MEQVKHCSMTTFTNSSPCTFVLLMNNEVHHRKTKQMSKEIKKVFVYTELQFSVPFDNVPWKEMNPNLLQIDGLVEKTWLSGVGSNSVGGFYEFETLEKAQHFAWNIFPLEAKSFGVSFITKIFDGDVVTEASKGMKSSFYN